MTGPRGETERLRADLAAAEARLLEAERALTAASEETARTRRSAESGRQRLEHEIELRNDRIRELGNALRERGRERDRARRELEALRSRRSVRAATAFGDRIRPIVGHALRRYRATRVDLTRSRAGVAILGVPEGHHRLRASAAEGRSVTERLVASIPTGAPTTGPLVTVIVLTRDGLSMLRTLLDALDRTEYQSFEVVVVDNGSSDGTGRYLAETRHPYPLRSIRNEENCSFAAANMQGAAIANGELLLLLNNDVRPLGADFLGHMVETLLSGDDRAAVGARLVYPRRRGHPTGPLAVARDLSLQHRGVDFVVASGVIRARNVGDGEAPDTTEARVVAEMPAVTAACALVRRSAWKEVGGMSDGYDYGMEDVDLCLKLRAAGWRVMYDGRAVLWHDASATQHRAASKARRERQEENRRQLLDRWGVRLFRETLVAGLSGDRRWSQDALHVGITVTRDDPAAGWGDWYTAHEVGEALEGIGWRVTYLERFEDRWYQPPADLAVVIVLLDAFDIRRIPLGIVTVAWCRNWIDRWLERGWFEDIDIVFAASSSAVERIEASSSVRAAVMPLATNPDRFLPRPDGVAPTVDVAFVGNLWGEDRDVGSALPTLADEGRSVGVWGKGWAEHPSMAPFARGVLDYDDVPAAYASAAIVVDDAADPVRSSGMLNSRVFDALATGTLVLTNSDVGAHELFDDEFPTWRDARSLGRAVDDLLADDGRRRTLSDRYRSIVLDRHTYARRAEEIRSALLAWVEARRISLLINPPDHEVASTWGDHHFARGLQRQFRRLGRPTDVRILSEWDHPVSSRNDVVVNLFGLRQHRPRSGPLNLLWVISHPDLVEDEGARAYDVVCVASDLFAEELSLRIGGTVHPLHQATDPDRFHPGHSGPAHDLLFVGNSRGVRRKIIDDVTPTTHDLAVYGTGWTPDLLDPRYLRGDHVPNAELAWYYGAAKIVLNDHWPDMRRLGFLSNRLYDALAAGAFVISDEVPGLEREFNNSIVSYETTEELRAVIERYLADAPARADKSARGRAIVLSRHTFAQRAAAILAIVDPLLEPRRPAI